MAHGDIVTLTAECASKGARDLTVKRIPGATRSWRTS